MALVLVMFIQAMALTASAVVREIDLNFGLNTNSSAVTSPSGIANLNADEVAEQLKDDFIKSLNKDLVQKIDDYELTGHVEVIITFSDDSLISAYTSSNYVNRMAYSEFKNTFAATRYKKSLLENQSEVLEKLIDAELIGEVKYNYVHMLDGAFVSTTYEKLDAICNTAGVGRVMISDTYDAVAAVENPVDVYETGIFNSGSVSYTGKGTIVAILDTGCDYAHSAFTSYTVQKPLYDRDEIEDLLEETKAYELHYANNGGASLEAREVYYGNITGNKIAFGYDYADKDPDIMPFENSHGTHVAGIIAGKDETIKGVAIDAQLAIMKVFSDYDTGAKDGDIIAALEDAIVLGVDAINMSLGTSSGFSLERDPDEEYKNELYGRIEDAGISLIVAASNDHSSGYGSEQGNTNKTDNPDSATIGSPATYEASLAVASISGKKDNYMLANGDHVVFFTKSYSTSADEYDFFAMMGIEKGEKKTYEYVTVPGFGQAVNYMGINVEGKIALVSRGDITFEDKVKYAQEAGAIAVIIYNNVYGDITMTIGNNAKIPAVSIGMDDGEKLASVKSGVLEFDLSNEAGPFMSDFSSWGPTPDLHLKPEITAHGGNILSAVVGGEYDEMSGTSMAAPNMCGIAVLIRQYVKEKYPEWSATQVRDLVNQLSMSTATIANDRYDRPYSPRKQGAGIADITKATTTLAYLNVDGIGKTKLELGDDPQRTGVYEITTLNLTNMSNTAVSYKLGSIVMTESISTAEPEYVAEIAYLLNAATEFTVEGGTLENGIVTVEGGKTAKIKAKITLSAEDKSYLNSTFENGMYVEGFITFDNTVENGVDLNVPFLAFYGDWGEAPIFDLDFYEEETEKHNDAIDEDDKIKADYYATTPLGTYYYDYIVPLGCYLYDTEDSEYTPTPATRERAAISYFKTSISGVYGVFTGLLRGAKEMEITVRNAATGEIVYQEWQYNCPKAHYSGGAPRGYMAKLDLDAMTITKDEMTGQETVDIFGFNNMKFEVTMSAKLDWNGGTNASDTYSFSFYIDYEAPTVVDATFRTEYDKSRKENRYYADVIVYDNHYAMSCRPIVIYDIKKDSSDEIVKTFSSLSNEPVPVYQENRGENSKVTIEITDYLDLIADSSMPNGLTVYIDDYAMNSAVCYIPFPETDSEDLEFMDSENPLLLDINQTFDLTQYFVHKDTATPVETDYLKTLKWSSSDESIVAISAGQIEAKRAGTVTIKVTSDSWVTQVGTGDNAQRIPIYKTLVVKVSENVIEDNPNSSENVGIEELTFASYKTLFAFNNDIDRSAIGETGSIHYFGGKYSVEFYPSEKIQLTPELKPWNIAEHRYEYTWTSSNPKVATVDQNGVVTAESEGKARITLNIKIDDKTSLLAARLSVEVKSEFIIENRKLVAYKGKGGDVVIPDDEGILYIGSYAFSHFDLDNTKVVEKDEHGYYDIDDKKTPLGNHTVTSVVIPEDVETIEKCAFYNCTLLTDVTLPKSCKTISTQAFEKCKALENINLDNVKVIADQAFYNCSKLTCEDLGGANLSGVYAIGSKAFYNSGLTSVELNGLSMVGNACFENCRSLSDVVLGERTRVGKNMFKNTAITEITIYGDTVGDQAFNNCTSLKTVVFEKDLTYLGASAFAKCSALENVTFKGQIEEIASSAFASCSSLTSLTLPNGKVKIGDSAFSGTALQKLVFAENTEIVELGKLAFRNVTGLTADTLASKHYKVEGNAVYTMDGATLVLVLPAASTAFEVPSSVSIIGSGAFSAVGKVVSVSFADDSVLDVIEKKAFADCTKLTSVTNLPERELSIKENAFSGTSSLTAFDFSNVSYIGSYAFNSSAISAAVLSYYVAQTETEKEKTVKIGDRAFANTSKLQSVALAKNAYVGDYAFEKSAVVSIELDGDATISSGAFSECSKLRTFDFADLTGKIANRAFFKCSSLTAVNAPKITEIGEGSFSFCEQLQSFVAPELTSIGNYAFSPYDGDTEVTFMTANYITSLDLPNLKAVGDYGFYGMRYLANIDISGIENLGEGALGFCSSLTSVVLNENCTELPNYDFANCYNLFDIDLSNVVKIGDGALSGVPFQSNLSLPKVEYIGRMAFIEAEGRNLLTSVDAPNLKYVGDQAFASCKKLVNFSAPNVEHIGEAAFAATGIVEFEISDALTEVVLGGFYNSEKFEAFYTVDENGNKLYSAEFDNFMIKEGVLYTNLEAGGYELTVYPIAKRDIEYVVADGTVLIDFAAATGNKYITKLVFPSSLESIGNLAFDGCEKLTTIVFNSYYAPTLIGSMSKADQINVDTVDNYPGFEDLYKYDFFWRSNNEVGMLYFYANFKDTIGSANAQGMTILIPDNCEGYDSMLYNAYFTVSEEETSGPTVGKYAIAFMNAVKKLPAVVDRFDNHVIEEAIGAYNALKGHSEELVFIDREMIERYNAACIQYNVSVAENKLAHLFDMDMTEYSFNLLKDARETYLALTEDERQLVSNAAVLDAKIAEMKTIYGKDIDFSLSYTENLPTDPGTNDPGDSEDGLDGWVIAIIVAASALLGAGAAVTIIFIKKKRTQK